MMPAELTDFAFGATRLAVPLGAVAVAAVFYKRVGLDNLALDGQLLMAAIVYTAGTSVTSGPSSLLLAVAVAWLVGILLVLGRESLRFDDLLLGLGLLYVCYGSARLICKIVFGNPGYALIGEGRMGDVSSLVVLCSVVVTVFVADWFLFPLRFSRVIGESREFASLDGLSVMKYCLVNSAVAAVLVGVAAAFLVEHGGSFSGTVSGERGFLALAIVAMAGTSLWQVCVWAIVIGSLQKVIYVLPLPKSLVDALPYALPLLLITIRAVHARYGMSIKRK